MSIKERANVTVVQRSRPEDDSILFCFKNIPMKPICILVTPWIYDFAAVNLWSRPLGLLKLAEYLSRFDLDLKL